MIHSVHIRVLFYSARPFNFHISVSLHNTGHRQPFDDIKMKDVMKSNFFPLLT